MSTDDYAKGAIRRIKLVNFMIHSQVEVRPGPRLNLVLGANGTGKSAVACAIGLGLGGSLKVVSRASTLAGFIKKDQDEALIEIELQGDGGSSPNPVVKRRIHRDGKNEWLINNTPRKKEEVEKFFELMNIQVNNLCQYLPQDQVGNFSKFDDKELLRETIRAVRGEKHAQLQDSLIEAQKKLKESVKSIEVKDKDRAVKTEELLRMERDVRRQEERERIIQDIKLLKIKIAWLRFDEARLVFKKAKDALEQVEREVEENRSTRLPELKTRASKCGKDLAKARDEVEATGQRLKQAEKAFSAALETVETHEMDTMKPLLEDMKDVDAQRRQAEQRVAKKQAELLKLQQQLAKARPEAEVTAELARLKDALRQASSHEAGTREALSAATVKRDVLLAALGQRQRQEAAAAAPVATAAASTDGKAYERLKLDTKGIVDAIAWVASKKNQTPVFGPVINLVAVKDDLAARALEMTVRESAFGFFVVTSDEDRDALSKACKLPGLMNIKMGSRPELETSPRPRLSKEITEELGLRGFLDEFVKAEPIVVDFLCKMNKIQHILIGSAHTDEVLERAGGEAALRRLAEEFERSGIQGKLHLYTPKYHRSVSKSRYDRSVSTMVRGLETDATRGNSKNGGRLVRPTARPAPPPLPPVPVRHEKTLAQLQQEVADAETHVKAAKTQHEAAENKEKEIKQQQQHLQTAKTEVSKLRTRIPLVETDLAKLEQEATKDWHKAAEDAKRMLQQEAAATGPLCRALRKAVAEMVDAHVHFCAASLGFEARTGEKEGWEALVREAEAEEGRSHAKVQAAKKAESDAREACRTLKAAAEKISHKPLDELKAEWAGTSDSLDELEATVRENQYKLDAIQADLHIIAEYEKRKSELQALEEQLEMLRSNVTTQAGVLQAKLLEWEGPVRDMVKQIDTSMRDFFQKIAADGYKCASEVELQGDPEDYSTFGVVISVKFREDQTMQRLSASVHSGGERSLTTFLYMLSLQSLSKAPFRLVDEINQGMDADKERLAFYRLQAVATGHKTPQYFVITPKLLPGLKYTPDTTILFVFNGFFNIAQKEWNVDKFVEMRRNKRLKRAGEEEEVEA